MKRAALGEGSLWRATAASAPPTDPLVGRFDTEILVIGGGIAGASTALHLAEAGTDVVLLEKGDFGDGATGQSGGLIAPDYIRHDPDAIVALFGREQGERLTRFVGESAAATFALARRLGIACDSRENGFWTPAHTAAILAQQQARAAQWSARGFAVETVDAAGTQRALGYGGYLGALRFGAGGSLNPLALTRGLVAAAMRAGAICHADSPVKTLKREGSHWVAVTPRGSVRARRLVLAANGGNAALHPALARTTLPLRVVEFATAPLDEAMRAHVVPSGSGFTDKTPYIFTARYDGHGHLVSAFPASLMVRGDAAMRREAVRRLAEHFPPLAGVEIRFLWRGLARINPSLLPALYDLGDDAIAIQACNGRGLSINAMLGREVARWVSGNRDLPLPVPLTRPALVRLHALARFAPEALMAMAYLRSRRGRA
ncbi:NAD(P)/FAD-dependent oxidoreductase [Sphingomonas baiyangensis]|uniref:FAD-binding oxidoreductase n=1 Tax=Sphingomonas baiyangensis TaxID=2572576 RepID=A0A4U1L2I4_9SPHN|nr:FAD-binding oxidoreductase [Sphingomonas baiyangensis]TKD51091.1 FAD-binding oxidoreductase [Sphingomonas baiyangensis]